MGGVLVPGGIGRKREKSGCYLLGRERGGLG